MIIQGPIHYVSGLLYMYIHYKKKNIEFLLISGVLYGLFWHSFERKEIYRYYMYI